LGRVRGKLKYRPVVFELLPPTFTLSRLQRVVEALAGVRLHKQNFRRLVERGGWWRAPGVSSFPTGGRPAELFRFAARCCASGRRRAWGSPARCAAEPPGVESSALDRRYAHWQHNRAARAGYF
jgi:hypothetical protein